MSRAEPIQKKLPSLWRIFSHFWPQIRKHRLLITGAWLALLAEVGLRLLEPWPLKIIFDTLFAKERRVYRVSFYDIFDPSFLVAMAALAIVVITALRALAAYWNTIGFAKLGNRVLTQVRTQLYRHVQYLSLSFHTRARTGDLVVRMIGDVGMLQDVAVTALLPMVAKLFILAGMVGLMLHMNWKLGLAALSVFPLFWLPTVTLGSRIREVARKQRQREGQMAATAAESIAAIKTVQALSLEGSFEKVFAAQNEKNLKQDIQGKRLAASLERSVDVLTAISGALVLWYGARLVMLKDLTPGDLLVFLAYLKNSFRPIQDFAKYTGRLGKATAAGERILDLLERVPDVRDRPDAVKAPAFSGEVRFQNVSFAYEHGRSVLEGIDLSAKAGQFVALVGPSGGGKTTLAGLILRLYDPVEGAVLLDGQDIRQFTLESLRAQISVVLQDNLLFAASVRENIACSTPDASMEQVEAAACLANAHEFITALPDGYNTQLGERGVTISQGQRQRIAIARAAIRKAPILILDEPTAALDKKNERAVLEALARLNRGRTTFLITHNFQHATGADVIVYIEAGRVVERGTHEELMRANGPYAATYRLQAHAAQPPELEAVPQR